MIVSPAGCVLSSTCQPAFVPVPRPRTDTGRRQRQGAPGSTVQYDGICIDSLLPGCLAQSLCRSSPSAGPRPLGLRGVTWTPRWPRPELPPHHHDVVHCTVLPSLARLRRLTLAAASELVPRPAYVVVVVTDRCDDPSLLSHWRDGRAHTFICRPCFCVAVCIEQNSSHAVAYG